MSYLRGLGEMTRSLNGGYESHRVIQISSQGQITQVHSQSDFKAVVRTDAEQLIAVAKRLSKDVTSMAKILYTSPVS